MKGTLTGRCASCREHHSADSMCPPHEVRATGHTWFLVYVVELETKIEQLKAEHEPQMNCIVCHECGRTRRADGNECPWCEVKRLQQSCNDQQDAIGDILGFASDDPNRRGVLPTTLAREVIKLRPEIERLQAVMDAADAFLATPPSDMPDSHHFGQSTTAGECRKLNRAYHEAVEAEEG